MSRLFSRSPYFRRGLTRLQTIGVAIVLAGIAGAGLWVAWTSFQHEKDRARRRHLAPQNSLRAPSIPHF